MLFSCVIVVSGGSKSIQPFGSELIVFRKGQLIKYYLLASAAATDACADLVAPIAYLVLPKTFLKLLDADIFFNK